MTPGHDGNAGWARRRKMNKEKFDERKIMIVAEIVEGALWKRECEFNRWTLGLEYSKPPLPRPIDVAIRILQALEETPGEKEDE